MQYPTDTTVYAPRVGLISCPDVVRATEARDKAREELTRFKAEHAEILASDWEARAERAEMQAAREEIAKDGKPDPSRPSIVTQRRDMRPRVMAQYNALLARMRELDQKAWALAQERASADVPEAHANFETAAEAYLAKWEELRAAKDEMGRAYNRLVGIHKVARGEPANGDGTGFPARKGATPPVHVEDLRRKISADYGEPTTERPIPTKRRFRALPDGQVLHMERLVAAALERSLRREGKQVEWLDGFPAESELAARDKAVTS